MHKNNLKYTEIIAIGLALLILFIAWSYFPGYAQSGTGNWENPINLSASNADSNTPSVAADRSGVVHVVWADFFDDGSSYITYTHLKNGSWSPANEIMTSPNAGQVYYPSLAADSLGNLHLVWSDTLTIYYSRSFSSLASSSQNWTTPQSLEYKQNNVTTPDLIVDSRNVLHVVYAISIGDASGIYYVYSDDQGDHWSEPAIVYKNFRSDRMVDSPRIAAGPEGSLHVVWTEYNFPDTFPAIGIRYTHRLPGETSWGNMISLADGPYRDSAIAVRNNVEVHVVWSGTQPDRFKFHRQSLDDGKTWRDSYRNQEVGGYQGYPALVVDSSQGLHWITVGTDFNTLLDSLAYFQWLESGWSSGEMTTPNFVSGNNPMNVGAAIALGNELHIVVSYPVESVGNVNGYQMDIYYFNRPIDAPAIQPVELILPTLPPTLTPAPTQAPSQDSTSLPPAFDPKPPNLSNTTMGPFLVGALAATVFLIINLLISSSRKRRPNR
jgi:hypothetical protein